MDGQGSINRILVGVDGSAQSAQALEWAIRLARCAEAEIVAVYVIPPPTFLEYGAGYGVPVVPAELDPEWRAETIQEFHDKWSAPLAASGLAYRTKVVDGRPAAVLSALADEESADLVVVGRRGRNVAAEMVLGSVSHELSHHCNHPVLLVSPQPAAKGKRLTAASSTAG